MPRILIGIPTLNRPEYVQLTVRSILEQTAQDFRILLSDNASRPDKSAAVASHVDSLSDTRAQYYLQPKNIREYGNCDFLFRNCEEEFFAIVHDDDLLEPGYLETAMRCLDANPDVDCFLSNALKIDSRGDVSPEETRRYRVARGRHGQSGGPIRILEPLMQTGFLTISGTVFRTAALRTSGFVDDDCFGLYPFEFNVFLRLGEREGRAYFASEELLRYRFHEGQMQGYQGIGSDPLTVGMVIQLLERRSFRGEAERLRRRVLSMFYNLQARIGVRADDLPACRRALRRAIGLNPWWSRHWPLAACAFVAPPLAKALVRRIDSHSRRVDGT